MVKKIKRGRPPKAKARKKRPLPTVKGKYVIWQDGDKLLRFEGGFAQAGTMAANTVMLFHSRKAAQTYLDEFVSKEVEGFTVEDHPAPAELYLGYDFTSDSLGVISYDLEWVTAYQSFKQMVRKAMATHRDNLKVGYAALREFDAEWKKARGDHEVGILKSEKAFARFRKQVARYG